MNREHANLRGFSAGIAVQQSLWHQLNDRWLVFFHCSEQKIAALQRRLIVQYVDHPLLAGKGVAIRNCDRQNRLTARRRLVLNGLQSLLQRRHRALQNKLLSALAGQGNVGGKVARQQASFAGSHSQGQQHTVHITQLDGGQGTGDPAFEVQTFRAFEYGRRLVNKQCEHTGGLLGQGVTVRDIHRNLR